MIIFSQYPFYTVIYVIYKFQLYSASTFFSNPNRNLLKENQTI